MPAGDKPPATRSAALKVWLADVIDLQAAVTLLDQQLKAWRQRRGLRQQIEWLTRTDPLGSARNLRAALIKDNRRCLGEQQSLKDWRSYCTAELACARDILSPRVLLQQARREWADLAIRAAAEPDSPSADAWLHRKREAVILRLTELIDALHPDVPMPDVFMWVEQRVEDLRREQRRLLTGIDPHADHS